MLRVLGTVYDLEQASISNERLRERLYEYLSALDENYGEGRDVYDDDGGYTIVIEDELDLYYADEYVYLGDENFEFIERLDDTYIQLLKLCNNEFSILVIINEDVCPKHLLDAMD